MKNRTFLAAAVLLGSMSMAACGAASPGTVTNPATEELSLVEESSAAEELSAGEEYTAMETPVTPETPATPATPGSLAACTLREYDHGGLSLKPVEGVLYLPGDNRIQIYYQGLLAGYLIAWETDPAEESFGALLSQWEMAQGNRAQCEMLEIEPQWTIGGKTRYDRVRFREQISAFSYGDTEWLVNSQVFDSEEEALDQVSVQHCLFLLQVGKPWGFSVFLNTLVLSDSKMSELCDAIQLSEEAFEGQPSFGGSTDPGWELLVGELFGKDSENPLGEMDFSSDSSRLRGWFDLGDREIEAPEGTIAVQMGENYWELYNYHPYYPESMGEIYLWDSLPDQIDEPLVQSILDEMNGADGVSESGDGDASGVHWYETVMMKPVFDEDGRQAMAEMGMMPEEADRERAETVRLIWDEETHRTVCMVTRVVSR